MIKGSIQKEDITIINIYAPNIGAPQYIRQMLTAIKEDIDNDTIIVGYFNTSLIPMDRSSKMKINKETEALNEIIDQIDLIDIYRTLHNDQGINPRRRYNNYKYKCTQHRSTSIHKATANSYKRGNRQ